MDQELQRFREAAARENRGRPAIRRRYSPGLQAQAVAYWHGCQQRGESLRHVAAALGVAPFSLERWTRRATSSPAFRPVALVGPATVARAPSLVVMVTADTARVEGLDVDTAAQLLRLLR
jgi:transposase-like protein